MANFFIDWKVANEIHVTFPFGIIIDLEEYNKDGKSYTNTTNKINSIIIKTYYRDDFTNIIKNNDISIYFIFKDEDDPLVREKISKLQDSDKKKIIGKRMCSTGVDILRYRIIGIRNIFVTSPFINDANELEMLKKIGDNLFVIPNIANGVTGIKDPSWIRPEGIKLYPNVDNWILYSDKNHSAESILQAYHDGGYIGKLKDILINFENDFNTDSEAINLLDITFDEIRTLCKGECLTCEECPRAIQLNRIITNGGEPYE